MMRSYTSFFIISASVLLGGCVPSVGNYSEFATYKIKQTLPTVDGQIAFADGIYRGGLTDGKPHGQGKLSFTDGRVYQGGFSYGELQGQGELTFTDGRVLKGVFTNGSVTNADIYYADGRFYRGAVKNGHAYGSGVLQDPVNGTIEGEFVNGRANGSGLLTDIKGSPVYAGKFRADLPHGEGVCVSEGVPSACSKEAGKDVTQRELARRAELSAKESVERDAKAKLAAVHNDFVAKTAAAAKAAEASRAAKLRWAGPPRSDACYCALYPVCLVVESSNESSAQRERSKLVRERKQLECRQKYAGFLDNKDRSDYVRKLSELNQKVESTERHLAELRTQQQQREAAIEAARKQALANTAHMRKLTDEARVSDERERKNKLDADRQRCLSGGAKAASCHCRAVLGRPAQPKATGAPARACEA